MLTKSFSILFYLKKRGDHVRGKVPIYIRLTVNGKRVEIGTKRDCEPEKWNSATGRNNGTKEDAKSLNAFLDVLRSDIYEAQRQLVEQRVAIIADLIKNKLLGISDQPKKILEVFQHHNDQLVQLVGLDFAPGTLKRYDTSLSHTREFIQWKFAVKDLAIDKLDYEFITEYEFWMKTVRKCNHNITMKYLSNFKKIVLI